MSELLPPDPSCKDCQEVIQICRAKDGQAVGCQQIPVERLLNGANAPSLTDMMPVVLGCAVLMALAWGFKKIAKMLGA